MTFLVYEEELKTDAEWLDQLGLSNVRVFGHDQLLGGVSGMSASFVKTQNTPHTYKVTVPFWAKGKDASSATKRVNGAALVELVIESGDAIRVTITKARLVLGEDLTFWRQVRRWLLTGFLVPAFIFLWLGANDVAAAIVSLLSLPLAAYGAFVCFGTVLAAFLGAAVYLALTQLVLRPILLSVLGRKD